jgi:hypothetical protein
MRLPLSVAAVLAASLLLFGGLLWLHPFELANEALDRLFHAAPRWTQVQTMYTDETSQELTRGDHPNHSFDVLQRYWGRFPNRPRVFFLGNSQIQTISLALGESRPGPNEKTYFDLVSDHYRAAGNPVLVYRLSAGGLTYPEALWYIHYLVSKPALKPEVIFLQLNYQSFWQGGVRNGMLELLDDPAFKSSIQNAIAAGGLNSDTFQEALKRAAELSRQSSAASAKQTSGYGAAAEAAVRSELERIPAFHNRHEQKKEFYELLYRCRLYFLKLKPSTARSVTGVRLLRSRASLEAIAELCRRSGVRLVLFHAPLNPLVDLYRTQDDRDSYYGFISDLASRYGITVLDLEKSVPEQYWGRYYNSPDPLHLGRRGHQLVAELIWPAVDRAVPAASANSMGGR